jgi:hypothetical protein
MGGGVGKSFKPNDDTRRDVLVCGFDDTIKSDMTTGKSSTIGAESAIHKRLNGCNHPSTIITKAAQQPYVQVRFRRCISGTS